MGAAVSDADLEPVDAAIVEGNPPLAAHRRPGVAAARLHGAGGFPASIDLAVDGVDSQTCPVTRLPLEVIRMASLTSEYQ